MPRGARAAVAPIDLALRAFPTGVCIEQWVSEIAAVFDVRVLLSIYADVPHPRRKTSFKVVGRSRIWCGGIVESFAAQKVDRVVRRVEQPKAR